MSAADFAQLYYCKFPHYKPKKNCSNNANRPEMPCSAKLNCVQFNAGEGKNEQSVKQLLDC